MSQERSKAAWTAKNGTLSDKTARKEFGLSEEIIIEAIRKGKLQYYNAAIYGNPYIKLIRHEVEQLVAEIFGIDYLENIKNKKELAEIDKEIKVLRERLTSLEHRKAEIEASLNNIKEDQY
jgi:hypothetical protein